MNNNYYYELVMCLPIYYKNLCIYPISFTTIYDVFGIDGFDSFMIPFCMETDYVKKCFGIDVTNENIFRDVILNNEELLKSVCFILTLFCQCGNITMSDNTLHLYDIKNKDIIFDINNDNFNDISDIILLLTNKHKFVIEKPPENMSERQKDIWEKLQAGRKRDEEKNRLRIYDIINICEFGGNYHIPISEITNWTIWKLMNTYNSIVNIRNYDDSLRIGVASYDLSSVQNEKCWAKRLMIHGKP